MKQLNIIKIGGNVINDTAALRKFVTGFAAIPGPKMLVHGGGNLATELSKQLGIRTKMHNGRRVTDAETLRVTTMVYAGWVNKTITALLNAAGNNSIGICGADMMVVPATKRKKAEIDFGFVGDVVDEKINTGSLTHLLERDIVPVVAPITASEQGQLLNTNADTIAASLAGALSRTYNVNLVFCFEKEGVLHNNEVIKTIDRGSLTALKDQQVVFGGMLPKLDNAMAAAEKGVSSVMIGSAYNIHQLIQQNGGTRVTAGQASALS